MQVKKYEAKTIKEAISLVKSELGPDAVILSAKDNNSPLFGKTGVEIIAAVPERSFQIKKSAESKIHLDVKEKLRLAPATLQKKYFEQSQRLPLAIPLKSKTFESYIDIQDEVFIENPKDNDGVVNTKKERVSTAISAAVEAFKNHKDTNSTKEPKILKDEIKQLKQEIEKLKSDNPNKEIKEFKSIRLELEAAGVWKEHVTEILKAAIADLDLQNFQNEGLLKAWIANYVLENVQVVPSLENEKLHFFIGKTGQGKSTSLCKVATKFLMQGYKIAIVSMDTDKFGANEKVKKYAEVLRIPFYEDWNHVFSDYDKYDFVFADMPGSSLSSQDQIQFLSSKFPAEKLLNKTHLVLSSNFLESDYKELIKNYSAFSISDLIITKVDESLRNGQIYSFHKYSKKPISIFGKGTEIPEDMEPASKERVLSFIFKFLDQGEM